MDTDPATARTTRTTPPSAEHPSAVAAAAARRAARRARRLEASRPTALAVYCDLVFQEVVRIATGRFLPFEVDDIAQRVVEKVLNDPAKVLAKHPNPEEFAWVATEHTGLDHRRRERVQRCEGAHGGHDVLSLDLEIERLADSDERPGGLILDPAEEAVGRAAAAEILALVDDDVDRDLVARRFLCDDRVTEIAEDRLVSHTTVSKRLRAAVRDLEGLLASGDYVSAS